MEEVGFYGTYDYMVLEIDPYLMHSCDKVLLNPYTQNQVLSNKCSYYIMAYDHGWMVTINGIQT